MRKYIPILDSCERIKYRLYQYADWKCLNRCSFKRTELNVLILPEIIKILCTSHRSVRASICLLESTLWNQNTAWKSGGYWVKSPEITVFVPFNKIFTWVPFTCTLQYRQGDARLLGDEELFICSDSAVPAYYTGTEHYWSLNKYADMPNSTLFQHDIVIEFDTEVDLPCQHQFRTDELCIDFDVDSIQRSISAW